MRRQRSPRASVNAMRPGRRIINVPRLSALLFNALPSLIAEHHSGLAGRGSSAQVVLHFLTIVKEVAAERNRLPTKALRTLGEDAHRPLGLPIACPFWTVQNIFSIL